NKKGEFITFNAASIPENLVESELFGTKKGGFTDAEDRDGAFIAAHNGTLFLDEIAEMPIVLQSKLLRVLEDWKIRKVGESGSGRKVNTMVLLATNHSLPDSVKEGLFRQDLYFRISTLHVKIPPLRERKQDIISLAKHLHYTLRGKDVSFSLEAEKKLIEYAWPGNVRELKSVMTRFAYSGRDLFEEDDCNFI
ncbi:sigma-54-dependent Fis family transcriptional regulator, partial [bacterium]|nr:sigma-54-dependent Fis family transcriptional regulator [bacterium]